MKRILFLSTLMLFVLTSTAAPFAQFTWDAPTHYEDGSLIPSTDTLSYTIYCSNIAGGPYNVSWDVGTGTSVNSLDLWDCVKEAGTYYFVATVTSSALGTTSTFSNEVSRSYSANQIFKKPMPPLLRVVEE
jgi:hypothetical protein